MRKLIAIHVQSLAELEALLLLFERPDTIWTAESLSDEMRSNPTYCQTLLEKLQATGLVVAHKDVYKLALLDERQRETLNEIAKLYRSQKHTLIDLIYQSPSDKIRVIADAFRIRS